MQTWTEATSEGLIGIWTTKAKYGEQMSGYRITKNRRHESFFCFVVIINLFHRTIC